MSDSVPGRLGELLATSAPPLGDPVVPYLLALPTTALLEEIADAVGCGYALPLERRFVAAPPMLMAALKCVELARIPHMTDVDPALLDAGASLDLVGTGEQVQILEWMLHRRGVAVKATNMIEGVIAMRAEGVEAGAGDADAAADTTGKAQSAIAGAATAMPPPIEKGNWERPGDMPGGLYVGSAVHRAIGVHYQDEHVGQEVMTNDTPVSTIIKAVNRLAAGSANGAALDETELARRPDILNLDLRHIYEIKPEAARDQARDKLNMYVQILSKAGIMAARGPMGDPGTTGQLPAPDGTVIFECVEPGVITYRYRHSRLVPVPVPAPSRSRSRKWKWAFEADLTPDQQKAMVTTTVGGALLILLMLVLAPVGA